MTATQPLVSIGMPVYNEARYLRQTIDAILAQDYQNFELIISDNASSDATPQICTEAAAKDNRIRYYCHPTNVGATKNFNKVFELAQGDYFVWAAGHDIWHPTFLSACVAGMARDKYAVLCYPRAVAIDVNGQPLEIIPGSIDTQGLDVISRFHTVLWGLGYCYPIYGVIKASALRQTGLARNVVGPDNILLAELSTWGTFVCVPEPLLYIRRLDDFGSWDKYLEKVFNQSVAELSAPDLFLQMIEAHLHVINNRFTSDIEKDAATIATVACLMTKYLWVLQGILESQARFLETGVASPQLKGKNGDNLEKLASRLNQSAHSFQKIFVSNSQKPILGQGVNLVPQILIDGVFFQLYNTGIARVWRSLFQEWSNQEFAKHIVVLDRVGTAPKIPGIRYRTIPAYDYGDTDADKQMLQDICDEEGADVFISTYYTTPISTPSVFMAYDMIPEVLGADFNQPVWREKHYGIQHASAYISISENTAQDLAKVFPSIALDTIKVAHCGVNPEFSPATPEEINHFRTKYGISKPYLLLVGINNNYKNAPLFLKAFSQLPTKQGFEIVAIGSGYLLSIDMRQYTSGVVVHLLDIEDAELKAAYSGAVALVYPSLYEGFGLPVLEAFACGCPVIACPNASIPEVAGEAAIYVNHQDVDGWVNALCDVQKPSLRQSMIEAGLAQAQKFSWASMAEKVSQVLIDATLLPLDLQTVNLIAFPDWQQPEESLGAELQAVLKAVATHPDKSRMTLLIYRGDISEEDSNLMLSTVAMNLLMEEDLDVSEGPVISLVGELSPMQWQALLPSLQARMALACENQAAITAAKAENLPTYNPENLP